MYKPSILVAEDNDDMRTLYTMFLTGKGFEVRPVCDGREALEELQRQRPDVILIDIAMPRIDGLELIRRIKGEEAYADVPVIVMTSYEKSYLTWAWALGADKTLSKPFDPDELFEAINQVLLAPTEP